jgi:hypothetical protein
MRMTLVFLAFAIVAGIAWCLFPHLGYGLGVDMMLAYLALALLSALIGLIKRPRAGDE